MQWRVLITLAGVDKSSQLVGEVMIDGEENSAVIAEFTLRSESGYLNPASAVGSPVLIDFIEDGKAPVRLFTGFVDVPKFDIQTGLTRFRCTDGLQQYFEAKTPEQVVSEIGGYWSPLVFSDSDGGWQVALDAVSTCDYSIGFDSYGVLSTAQKYASTGSILIGDGDFVAGSLELDLPSYRDMLNAAELKIELRYTDFVDAEGSCGWGWQGGAGDLNGRSIPTPADAQSAASSAGHELSFNYVEFPPTGLYDPGTWSPASSVDIASGNFVSWINNNPAQTCKSFSARVGQRATAETTVVMNARLEGGAAAGAVATETLSLDFTAQPPSGWSEYQSQNNHDDSFGAREPEFVDAVWAFLHHHAEKIRESLRARVRFSVPISSDMQRGRLVALESSKVECHGPVCRFKHRLDCESGSAVTDIELGVCVQNGSGDDDFYAYPDQPPQRSNEFIIHLSYTTRPRGESGSIGFQVNPMPLDIQPRTVTFDHTTRVSIVGSGLVIK